MTSEQLKRLEDNYDVKREYVRPGGLITNIWVILPGTLFILGLFGTYFSYGAARTNPMYWFAMAVCGVVAIIAFLVSANMYREGWKNNVTRVNTTSACVAKKLYGNNDNVYIYTTGNKRHDVAFLDNIADKIVHIDEEPDPVMRERIRRLFRADSNTPVLLPEAFTGGEEVYEGHLQCNDDEVAILSDHGRVMVVNRRDVI